MPELNSLDRMELVCRHGADGYYLIGGKCSSCKETIFPKPAICPRCTGMNIEEVPLSCKGKLYTYTEVHQNPPDYGGISPYIIGRVLLPEGVFVLSQLDAEFDDLKINMEMQLTVKNLYTDACGNEVTGYMFAPADLK
jgi:uncharacterized OB-fold protein